MPTTTRNPFPPLALLSLAVAFAWPAQAQTPPDAGQTLQQLNTPVQPPVPSAPLNLPVPSEPQATPAGGARVTVTAVSITGTTVFTEAELLRGLGPVVGQNLDLAGLQALAAQVSQRYREAGHPFARAFLPPQAVQGGRVRIDVVEARYGEVTAAGDPALAGPAQAFLAPLRRGELIESALLERTALLLDDLPDVVATPLLKPGASVGTGDLEVRVRPERPWAAEVGNDNHGSRYTGYNRLRAQAAFNGLLQFGDQLVVRGLYTDENLILGGVSYAMPLGASGLRGQFSYALTSYELGREFANLQAHGTAAVATAGVSYPLVRTQRANLLLSGHYAHKRLKDETDATATLARKRSDALQLNLQFDRRDALGGGGITYGLVGLTMGRLRLDPGLTAGDVLGTRGGFNKLSWDVVRAQTLPGGLSFFGRLSGQWAGKNLDSSESFTLGGANGVRAYPVGEGSGDEGWLAQLELRYAMGAYAPYVFYDLGGVRTDAKPAAGVANNRRELAGAGLGVRWQSGPWQVDASLAWRARGGAPQADTSRDPRPRVWVSAGYRF